MANDTNNKNGSSNIKETQKVKRFFALTNAALANKTSVIILMFIILGIGVTSYITMPKENYPEVNVPQIYIGVAYPGNSPIDMENLVTRYIEQEINTITGLDEITSTSIQDFTSIVASFDFNVNVEQALLDVKDAVDRAKSDLPNDLPAEPNVFKLDFSELPVINVNLTGDVSVDQLKEYAEYLQEEIEKFPEISGVDLRGVQEKEISINVDFKRMEALEISFGDIEQAISSENISMSGGNVISGDNTRSIRIIGEFENIKQIENVIVKRDAGDIVYLRNIANVDFGYEKATSYARSNQLPILTLDVKKRSGKNLLDAADKIKALVAEVKESRFPETVAVTITNDTSKQTRSMLANLNNSIISGVLLVVVVLLFFLGLRNALFVGIAIPLSMLMGIGLLNFAGVALNIMVLFSLVLALGMLVDNGIVVVENIYRLMDEEDYEPMQAAKEGVGEVAWPIIVSTATTIAAFAPLLFWDDIMGEFMKYLPITLIMVLLSSLFVALVINPVLTSMYMKIEDKNAKTKWLWFFVSVILLVIVGYGLRQVGSNLIGGFLIALAIIIVVNKFIFSPLSLLFRNYFLPLLERFYRWVLKGALWGFVPVVLVIGTLFLFTASMGFYFGSNPKVDLFPESYPNYINIFVQKPIGTDIESTNELAKEIEADLANLLEEHGDIIDSELTQVGEGTSDPNSGEVSMGESPNKARINVTFVEFPDRKGKSTNDILEMLREELAKYPGVDITVDKDANGPPVGKPINLEVSGEDYVKLIELTDEIKAYLNDFDVPGVEGLKTDLETGKPEIIVNLNRDQLRRYGLSTGQIASNIRTSVFGKEISKLKDGEDDYPIWLRFNEQDRYNVESILNQKVTFRNNQGRMVQVPISTVASKEYSSTYGAVKRKDLKRVITIYSNVNTGYTGQEITAKYKDYMAAYEMPDGYEYKFTGQEEQSGESSAFLMQAFIIAMGLIFLLLVTQFNSIISPFIILFTVAMSLIGVFFGYGFANMPFIIIMSGIGVISLAGIVVNNGIVLIDYINLERTRRRADYGIDGTYKLSIFDVKDTIIRAGGLRLRPVLLTAITTVLGLIPLAVGININFASLVADLNPQFYLGGDNTIFYGPMAWAVIFGLVFATFLTLIMVPVLYFLADRMMYLFAWTKEKITKEKVKVYTPEKIAA